MWFGKMGDRVLGHVHKVDHASLCINGGVRINPCEDSGKKTDEGKIIWTPLPKQGVDYVAHDAVLMKLVAKMLNAKTDNKKLGYMEELRNEYVTPHTSNQISAANIVAGISHEIVALYDRTLFVCAFSCYWD